MKHGMPHETMTAKDHDEMAKMSPHPTHGGSSDKLPKAMKKHGKGKMKMARADMKY